MAPTIFAKTVEELGKLSLWDLADTFDRDSHKWDQKIAAQVAFALALAIKRAADSMGEGFRDKKVEYLERARRYAGVCVNRLTELESETLEDVAPHFTSLAGVTMPNYFYVTYVTNQERYPDFHQLLS